MEGISQAIGHFSQRLDAFAAAFLAAVPGAPEASLSATTLSVLQTTVRDVVKKTLDTVNQIERQREELKTEALEYRRQQDTLAGQKRRQQELLETLQEAVSQVKQKPEVSQSIEALLNGIRTVQDQQGHQLQLLHAQPKRSHSVISVGQPGTPTSMSSWQGRSACGSSGSLDSYPTSNASQSQRSDQSSSSQSSSSLVDHVPSTPWESKTTSLTWIVSRVFPDQGDDMTGLLESFLGVLGGDDGLGIVYVRAFMERGATHSHAAGGWACLRSIRIGGDPTIQTKPSCRKCKLRGHAICPQLKVVDGGRAAVRLCQT